MYVCVCVCVCVCVWKSWTNVFDSSNFSTHTRSSEMFDNYTKRNLFSNDKGKMTEIPITIIHSRIFL